jgi:chemotaxis protein MotB
MPRTLWPALAALPLVACVATARLNEQVGRTLAEQKRADDAEAQAAVIAKTLDGQKEQFADEQKQVEDLQARLKASDDEIAALQKSNRDLADSLTLNKNDLKKKLSDLVAEKDQLTQKMSDLVKSTADQISDLGRKLEQAEADKAALQREKDDEVARARKSLDEITASLKSEIDKGAVQIQQLQGKLTLNMVDKVLFQTGEAEVNADGRRVLDRIGQVLNSVKDKDIRIEGFTDDRPISGELRNKYPSNWELSTARATAVARYLQDNAAVDPKRLVVTGFGEYRPIVPNDTSENRALNRRIEIVLVPRD